MFLAGMMENLDSLNRFDNGSGRETMTNIMKDMMWPYRTGAGRVYWQFHWILELLTWGLVIALLVAAVRWLWRKGDEASKRK